MTDLNPNPIVCDKCKEFLGQIARVFPSLENLQDEKYMKSLDLKYLGGDKFSGDPITSIAVWPGKSNALLHLNEYQFCCPMHPNCSHEYEYVSVEGIDGIDLSEIEEIFRQGKIRDAKERIRIDDRYAENVEANEERIRLERKFGPIWKADLYSIGIWEEPTCCYEPESDLWLAEYIDWKLTNTL
ncbi:hypothetical protein [Leptospira adleri]|uniref:Uncharacterized protein n=1 Tax=Leptospira adleri TaxID=2023186 RepID=A0A2M9YIY6_9LEPT|nr:hypothetical protein [Leptospira adleri]PJZ51505.1 hypothetical protein CH380_19660 [Leptospira adleri]PJZ61587.1 hypothetical protein CH376_12425 [Leptospira adleri]